MTSKITKPRTSTPKSNGKIVEDFYKYRNKLSMEIIGQELNLDEVLEGVITLHKHIQINKYNYRSCWDSFLPKSDFSNEKEKMSYNPVVCMRKCYPEHGDINGKVRDIPYFIFVLNQARDNRPKSADQEKEKDNSHCKLCKNVLDNELIISEIDDFFLTPNGFPYHNFASLLISKNLTKKQGDLEVKDVETWMKTSTLLDQYIFYNTMGAGASIEEHQHAQVVDPEEIRLNNETIPYPILNPKMVDREVINGKEGIYRLRNYAVDALIFKGRGAPYKVTEAAHEIKSGGNPFNILINKDEAYIIKRNPEREISICIRRKVGGYELSGMALLGDIEEKSGKQEYKMKGAQVFTNMTYDVFWKNVAGATNSIDNLANKYSN